MSVETRNQLAVALHYDKKGAPRVVAKGRGTIGEKIIEVAKAHDIPIEENEVLAGALSHVELGDELIEAGEGLGVGLWIGADGANAQFLAKLENLFVLFVVL